MNDYRGLWHGKDADSGKWVTGDLLKIPQMSEHGKVDRTKPAIMERTPVARCLLIEPSTAGECAGIPDKNDKLIFEGDIVKTLETDSNGKQRCFPVVYSHGAFWLYDELLDTKLDFLGSYEKEALEIIGNVFDNPELLKGENDEM